MTDVTFTGRMTAVARRLLSLTDLTSLNDSDDEQAIQKLLKLAVTDAGKVAAVCCWARFIPMVAPALQGTGIALAAVANFPAGAADATAAAEATATAVAAGATEVDVVLPYRALLAGDEQSALRVIRACRQACGSKALLKVILETGQLGSERNIRLAAEVAINGGAHFLKTSTGKTQPGATLEAAEALLNIIAVYQKRGTSIGLKVSGGIRRIEQARAYLDLYEDVFGIGSANATNFRIGASSLVKDILTVLR